MSTGRHLAVISVAVRSITSPLRSQCQSDRIKAGGRRLNTVPAAQELQTREQISPSASIAVPARPMMPVPTGPFLHINLLLFTAVLPP
jgi:hypothetical protein